MMEQTDSLEFLIDHVTKKKVPNVGAEQNRQAVERFLVGEKGYSPQDIRVDAPIRFDIKGEEYGSAADLAVGAGKNLVMVFKIAAGSLGSREREALAAARLLEDAPAPLAVVSDGRTAIVLDGVTGKKTGEGLSAIPSKQEAGKMFSAPLPPLPEKRLEKERIIFRSYDSMNVNLGRKLKADPG